MEGFRDEGGLFGVAGSRQAAHYAYLGLHGLQHRGRHGAGLVTSDGSLLRSHHGSGLVHDVFGGPELQALTGHIAVGQVHHDLALDPLSGAGLRDRPLVARYRDGQIAVTMVGQLTNHAGLAAELEAQGAVFSTRTDAELLVHLLARSPQRTFVNRLVDALWKLEGAFSIVLCTEDQLVAVRDPHGFRPLVLGRLDGATLVASEEGAFQLLGAAPWRQVEPGEMIIVDPDRVADVHPFPHREAAACAWELVELARADAFTLGRSAYDTRQALGARLAAEQPCEGAEVVVAVPDAAIPAALGFATAAGVPFQHGLVSAPFTGRRFMAPTREVPDLDLRLEVTAVPGVLLERRVVLVASSLVLDEPGARYVRLLREAGAMEVHVRVAAPLMRGACFYGIHTPTREEMALQRHRDLASLGAAMGADSVAFLSLKGLRQVLGGDGWCDGCVSGRYPVIPEERLEVQLTMFEEEPE